MKDEKEKTRAQKESDEGEKAIYALLHEYGLTEEQVSEMAKNFSRHIPKAYDTKKKRCLRLLRSLRFLEKEFRDRSKAQENLKRDYQQKGISRDTCDPSKAKARDRIDKKYNLVKRAEKWAEFDPFDRFWELFSHFDSPLNEIVSRLAWNVDTESQLQRREGLLKGIAAAGPALSRVHNPTGNPPK